MSIAQSLLPEFDQEMANTRKILELVPEDKLDYKPHEKSMALGRLAGHVAEMAGWFKTTIELPELVLQPGLKPFAPTTRQELLETFDRGVVGGREQLAKATDEHMLQPWSLKVADQVFFTMPRIAVLRNMVMNHLIHHRAQLGVYLRLNDVALPGMYGPSADEMKMWETKKATA
jgi:uncharacterized damage-inducible protein DinB